MWVGGPQVDPGYQGYLFCPIYNLSNVPVPLNYGDPIAVIDFATTTPPGAEKEYKKPRERSRVTFDDYAKVTSGLADLANKDLKHFGEQIRAMQGRIETFVTIMVAAIAVLVGAVTVIAAKSDNSEWYTTPFILFAACTFAIALLAVWQSWSAVRIVSAGEKLQHKLEFGRLKFVVWLIAIVALFGGAISGVAISTITAVHAQAEQSAIQSLEISLKKTEQSVSALQRRLAAIKH
jgi:hypothetical protein